MENYKSRLFSEWLSERKLAVSHRIRFYVQWVERFERFRKGHREGWRDSLRLFVESLDAQDMEDWRVRQAAESVELYFGQFAPDEGGAGAIADPGGDNQGRTWLVELERILRLRHYSPRTLAAYADWSRRFIGYAGGGAKMPTDEDAQIFLSHLAKQR